MCLPETPLQETFETLYDLQKTGKIRYIGAISGGAGRAMIG
ncbi:hypothetical protein [Sulfitobacter aestuariivivens]|nr:hypothetical protein [Sulfitobacter aestuariivivens]